MTKAFTYSPSLVTDIDRITGQNPPASVIVTLDQDWDKFVQRTQKHLQAAHATDPIIVPFYHYECSGWYGHSTHGHLHVYPHGLMLSFKNKNTGTEHELWLTDEIASVDTIQEQKQA